ncbi:MAG: 2-succinyl-5-enolpyruvyl-6-hydroxy-3-cyclohexene-1-carboxylic-acid synthase [Planctomycetes bacterium]|nr:2-succinyl-5-enolpyruvyl-6-hydroxy-3-cyclohexene-1-carboxylic-acid synthase [Planctomycetota bacterium]
MNVTRAERVLQGLAALGVRACAIAPGARNSPLVAALEVAAGFERYRFFEERSAAFFALGRARALGAPAAVITTSGTAAAECLPAAIEGYYSGVPLVIVTADRPARLRGTGAPQTIEQRGLFQGHAPTVTFETSWPDLPLRERRRPVHINVPFDEPLLERAPAPRRYRAAAVPPRAGFAGDLAALAAFLEQAALPLVLVGALEPADVAPVRRFLKQLGAPVHAEPHSGLREDPELAGLLLRGGDRVLRRIDFDAVLRLGGVPALRLWRDLDRAGPPVFSVSALPRRGMSRGGLLHGTFAAALDALSPTRVAMDLAPLRARDRAFARALDRILEAEPRSEPALVRGLSRLVPPDARVYLGNSLPLREWDLVADRAPNRRVVRASRGANGIDGQVSTFLGLAEPGAENWAVIGDLTALYDLAAPWVVPQLADRRLRIVVVNNRGGRIFGRLFAEPAFVNQHEISFEPWARMWKLDYVRWEAIPAARPDAAASVIEVVPDLEATRRVRAALDALER